MNDWCVAAGERCGIYGESSGVSVVSEKALQKSDVASLGVGAEHCNGGQEPMVSEQFSVAEPGAIENAATGRVAARVGTARLVGRDFREGSGGVHGGDQEIIAGLARGDEGGCGCKVSQVELADFGQFIEPPRENLAAMGSRWWAAGGGDGGGGRCRHECSGEVGKPGWKEHVV